MKIFSFHAHGIEIVSWENALKRERTRQKRHRQGGKQTELSDRLEQHQYDDHYDQVVVVSSSEPLPKKGKQEPVIPHYPEMVQELLQNYETIFERRCPFHGFLLDYKTTKSQWSYYRCPLKACIFFCGTDRVDDWLQGLDVSLHANYKERPNPDLNITLPFLCFCKHLQLSKSQSQNNPGWFFMACWHKDTETKTGCSTMARPSSSFPQRQSLETSHHVLAQVCLVIDLDGFRFQEGFIPREMGMVYLRQSVLWLVSLLSLVTLYSPVGPKSTHGSLCTTPRPRPLLLSERGRGATFQASSSRPLEPLPAL